LKNARQQCPSLAFERTNAVNRGRLFRFVSSPAINGREQRLADLPNRKARIRTTTNWLLLY
jgi:hypothetical protein